MYLIHWRNPGRPSCRQRVWSLTPWNSVETFTSPTTKTESSSRRSGWGNLTCRRFRRDVEAPIRGVWKDPFWWRLHITEKWSHLGMDRNGKLQILEMRMDLSSSESVGMQPRTGTTATELLLLPLLLFDCFWYGYFWNCYQCYWSWAGAAILVPTTIYSTLTIYLQLPATSTDYDCCYYYDDDDDYYDYYYHYYDDDDDDYCCCCCWGCCFSSYY